jgi:hypothetical protein
MQVDAPIAPLLFNDALRLCPNGSFLLEHFKDAVQSYQHISFLRMVKINARFLTQLQPFCAFSWIILEKNSKHLLLRYNSKYSKHTLPRVPTLYWIFNGQGCLLEHFSDQQQNAPIPFLLSRHNFKYFKNTKPLWQLLNLNARVPDPTTIQETFEFLATHCPTQDVSLTYYFANTIKGLCEMWHVAQKIEGKNSEPKNMVHLQLCTLPHFALGFQLWWHHHLPPPQIEIEEKKKKEKCASKIHCDGTLVAQKNGANRSSAISVKLTGLNLAYTLGLVTLQELQNWSFACASQYCITMWLDYDDQFYARFLTLYSRSQIRLQKEIPPPPPFNNESNNSSSSSSPWQLIFNELYAERDILVAQKKTLLAPLFERLQQKCFEKLSLYKKCFQQITTFVEQVKVIVYSSDDTALHALKIPLATYLIKKKGKKFKHLTLNVGFKNNLSTLNTADIIFFNMNLYGKQDIEQCVAPNVYLPTPLIKNSIKALKHGKQPDHHLSLFQLCLARGKQFSPRILESYTRVVSFFMHYFQYDIALGPILSLSLLSYQSIWTYYSKLAGPFHQGLEKTKTNYDALFRKHSHGGFSFSCQAQLSALQDELHNANTTTTTNRASTILELDIVSSYGFAGSHVQTPKGFCTAFKNKEGKGHILTRVEPVSRHCTFEFLAVYYTIFTIINEACVAVHTIFSNFHQNGLFSIDRYILDLAVVNTQGQLFLFQFDGNYAHGCRQGCASLKSYINGKSRSQVEKDTQQRDECILEWVQKSNYLKPDSVFYHVITDCHDTPYTISSLKSLFKSHSFLSQIVEGYPMQKHMTRDDIVFCHPHLTYLIILEGYIPLQQQNLLIHKAGRWQRTHCTFYNEPILMSKDYLDWLVLNCNFQITIIHNVFFYKKCFILNQIFKQLIDHRLNQNTSSGTKQLFKNIINYAVGFFGLNNNSKRQKTTQVKLVPHLHRRYNIFKEECTFYDNNFQFFIKHKLKKTNTTLSPYSQTPLPLFIMIIDYGKLRLAQILSFFNTFFDPLKYRLLYSNVDNLVLALSTETLLDAVIPSKLTQFKQKSNDYFLPNTPGHLKLEWIVLQHQQWKFVSPCCMTYVLLTNDPNSNQCKTSSLNILSEHMAYEYASKLLENKSTQVSQTRRVNKLLNKNVKETMFIFNKK